jgi:hypothetical protein
MQEKLGLLTRHRNLLKSMLRNRKDQGADILAHCIQLPFAVRQLCQRRLIPATCTDDHNRR